jgi:hypothetical protein
VIRRRKRDRVLPDQRAVVDRVLCASVVAMLGAIWAAVREGTMGCGEAAKYAAESHRWLRRERLADALSIRERSLISKSLTDWSEREAIDAGRRSETVGVLLWALSTYDEMPAYDTPFETLPDSVPLLAATAGFRSTAQLRSPEEIAGARESAWLWHWRSRIPQPRERNGSDDAGHDADATVREQAAAAYAENRIPEPIDGDFPAYSKAYRVLDAGEYAAIAATSAERHYALNWLCGYAADWDSVPTAT